MNTRRASAWLGAVGGLAALLWLALPWLAGAALHVLAQSAGLREPYFAVSRVGLHEAELDRAGFAFRAGAGTLEVAVKEARLDYRLGFGKAELQALDIGEMKLAWRPAPSAAPAGAPSLPSVALPLRRLGVARLALEVDTALGRSGFAGAAEITAGEGGGLEARLQDHAQTIRIDLAPAGSRADVAAELAGGAKVFKLHAERQADAGLRVDLDADAKALLAWLEASAWLPDRLREKAALPKLRESFATLAPRLAVTLLTASGEGLARVDGRLLDAGRSLATAHARLDKAGPVDIDIRLDAPVASLSALAAPWLPTKAQPWRPQAGDVRGRAELRRSGGTWSGTAAVEAAHLALNLGQLRVENAGLALRVTDLRARQAEFSADIPTLRLGERLAAGQLAVRADYRPGRLALRQAGAAVFGGRMDIAPADIDPSRRPIGLTLHLQGIDLDELLQTLKQEGLSGTGKVSGELPVRIDESGLAIDDGALSGIGPGVLRYRGPLGDPNNIAFKALRNLAYHSLQAKFDYRPDGEYRVGLRLEGANPELLEGHPLAFNLNLSGKLDELLRAGLLSGDWDRSILERAEKQRREGAH